MHAKLLKYHSFQCYCFVIIMKRSTILCSFCVLILHIFLIEGNTSSHTKSYKIIKNLSLILAYLGYTETEQDRWHHKHIECGGKHQSPIAINSMKVRNTYKYSNNRHSHKWVHYRRRGLICRPLNLFHTTIYCRDR